MFTDDSEIYFHALCYGDAWYMADFTGVYRDHDETLPPDEIAVSFAASVKFLGIIPRKELDTRIMAVYNRTSHIAHRTSHIA
ncbi:MAG: hypothetical protein IJR63_02925 [Synergistaceae bacterium]|nr:hypothetical protein [Synergistaceae bacterium]